MESIALGYADRDARLASQDGRVAVVCMSRDGQYFVRVGTTSSPPVVPESSEVITVYHDGSRQQ